MSLLSVYKEEHCYNHEHYDASHYVTVRKIKYDTPKIK